MNVEVTSDFLGACFEARRIVDLMPKLPANMKPGHIHVIDIIYQLQQEKEVVRVSDISDRLHVTNPGITRLVNELVDLKAVKKVQSRTDKRVFTVALTALGMDYYQEYIKKCHETLAEKFAGITESDMETAARVIREAFRIMSDRQHESDHMLI